MAQEEKLSVHGFFAQRQIDWTRLTLSVEQTHPLIVEFEVSPRDFLSYALEDERVEGERALVNALCNAKRAIDTQVDRILIAVGTPLDSQGFPARLEKLATLGILTPRILRKVNTRRNQLEHERRRPTREDVEDAVDVAMLFLDATDHLIDGFPVSIELGGFSGDDVTALDDPVDISFSNNKKSFTLRTHGLGPEAKKLTVTPDTGDYLRVLQFCIRIRKGFDVDSAVRELTGVPMAKVEAFFMT